MFSELQYTYHDFNRFYNLLLVTKTNYQIVEFILYLYVLQ
jgi:hypothetical protein